MAFFEWKPYVSTAAKRIAAAREVARLKRQGRTLSPVIVTGRKMATSFWGAAWCTNLESYSDYANRLPRGRSYARNGCVVDLAITRGAVTALVSGSSLYEVRITIAPVPSARWKAICRESSGAIDSLVELLRGRFPRPVMDRICRQREGLFPSPAEIGLSCSCPDSASMCKHVAASLYGVGARLDAAPELLFLLRGVEAEEMITQADAGLRSSAAASTAGKGRILVGADLGAIFGLELGVAPAPTRRVSAKTSATRRKRTAKPVRKAKSGGKGMAATGKAAKARKAGKPKTVK